MQASSVIPVPKATESPRITIVRACGSGGGPARTRMPSASVFTAASTNASLLFVLSV
jgi:hypothetical protein